MESNWTVFKKRLQKFQPRNPSWSEITIILLPPKGADTASRKKTLEKFLVPGDSVLLEGRAKKHSHIFPKESVGIRGVICGILPYVKITSLYWDANSATDVCLNTLRLMDSSVKSRRKVLEKGSVALLKESLQLGCVSKEYPPKM